MSRAHVVMKREFTEMVRTRSFLIGTILGPLLIVGFFALQFFILSQGGGGNHQIVVVDATGAQLGERIEAMLEAAPAAGGVRRDPRTTYTVDVESIDVASWTTRGQALRASVAADEIDGFLYIAPEVVAAEAPALYQGENATNASVLSDLRASLQSTVQTTRLAEAGIDPAQVGTALRPVRMESSKVSAEGERGSAEAALILGIGMAFAIYMSVLLYGAAVMNGVLEEKRDKIVELILSSVRAQDLLIGKVIGIGGAGLLQMAIWVGVAALMLGYGAGIAGIFGADAETIAQLRDMPLLDMVPASSGPIFLVFFAAGFLIYSTLYAALGAISNNAQEAQQFVFPIIMPLIIGLLIGMNAVQNPDATMVVVGSLFPLTAPLVMPVRATIGGVPPLELALSIVLTFAAVFAILWMASKIYRIGILSSGKRPTVAQLMRWVRTS
ncbi:MAG: ABC transporter permease [Longimicrobiales bacterium]